MKLKAVTNRRARDAARLAGVFLGLALGSPAAAQCAMCRRALLSAEGQQIVGAFRSGILFLLVAPFAVFAVIAVLAVRAQRRRVREARRRDSLSVDRRGVIVDVTGNHRLGLRSGCV